jgi:hypothetical protein
VGKLTVKQRRRLEGKVFQNFGEPAHRIIAEFLVGLSKSNAQFLELPNPSTKDLSVPHRAVMLIYPVREHEKDKISIGFELLFPKNQLGFDTNFTVRKKAESDSVIVSV